MIDSPNLLGAAWARATVGTPRIDAHDARDAFGWHDASIGEARICGDLNPAARGLSVAQHAAFVLAALCGHGDAQGR